MFDGEVERLAFGGQGIVHHQGLVVFVPFTAPGDRIQYKLTHLKKRFAKGKLVNILQENPHRIIPKCPYFGTCGGCQLQHLTYEMQLEHKRQCIEDALTRIGHLSFDRVLPVIPAPQWGYRRHITLNLKSSGAGFEAGYIRTDQKTLIKIDQCSIFSPSSEMICLVQEIAAQLEYTPDNEGRVTIFKYSEDRYILYFRFKWLPKNSAIIFKKYLNSTRAGILASSPKKTMTWGDVEGVFKFDGMSLHFSPTVFIQNHLEQSFNIYHQILKTATSIKAQKILDLYCGIGISSLILAKHLFQVTGVECNTRAIELAKKNANTNKINNLNFMQADAKDILPSLLSQLNPDLVLVNPPRTGLDSQVIQTLLDQPPSTILYISCMPSTLARDLQIFCRERFKINLIQPYDMFPQTGHVETLVVIQAR